MPNRTTRQHKTPGPIVPGDDPAGFRRALGRWFARRGRDLPWRRTRDPYAILVSEAMLQQTQVATVIPYYERWLRRFPDIPTLAAATEEEVLALWQGLGYYARARNLRRAAQTVRDRFGGRVPPAASALQSLPGFGDYAAAAVAAFAFDAAVPAIDANIARVLARLIDCRRDLRSAAGRRTLRDALAEVLPAKGAGRMTAALMDLGALLCTPVRPGCGRCPVRGFCRTRTPEAIPAKKARRPTVHLTEDCAWVVKDGRILLRQETGAKWRHLWKLPPLASLTAAAATAASGPGEPDPRATRDARAASRPPPLWTGVYAVTHHRVTLRVYPMSAPRRCPPGARWVRPVAASLAMVPLAAAHRRAIEALRDSPAGVKSAAARKSPTASGRPR